MFARRLLVVIIALLMSAHTARSAELPLVTDVERQPLAAQARRLVDALDYLGVPLSAADKQTLAGAAHAADEAQAVRAIQTVLDQRCLAGVRIQPAEQAGQVRLTALPGAAPARVAEQGWTVFLVKVFNDAERDRVELKADSPNALPMFQRSTGKPDPKVISAGEVQKRFLELDMFNLQPLLRQLSGLKLEYRIVSIYCRDAGRRPAELGFSVWPDNAKTAVASSNLVPLLVDSAPAVPVRLQVIDHDGKPTMASFVFRDAQNRVYPAQTRRLAPDFGFQPQIYRADGETVFLQPGKYTVTYTRGPEYLLLTKEIAVPDEARHAEKFELKRWIHPAARGWYSGDHHVHAAGCAHYESPTEGVTPEDMMRHILGEDLNVGCCLSWGPCWYHQKRYFDGQTHPLSTPNHLLRYDVEVSGFPSSHCGHICLLRLREQDYPGTKLINDWPSWDLPIFKWAKAQGGVVGFAHSGWGLVPVDAQHPDADTLPNYLLPSMSGIGANEYLVDVAHGMCDFISTVDTPSVWELNIWYHTLNCGYRCRISGETDFPCIYGQRVGMGRSYVHLAGKLNFDDWAEGIKQGRSYVSDGKSHLLDFAVNGVAVGTKHSEVRLPQPGMARITANVAALLEPKPTPKTEAIRQAPLTAKPYWDIERCRIGDTRTVPVEVVVNGYPVMRQEIVADGKEQPVTFEVPIARSSWVCLRILPSSHTNPVFVLVEDKPIRASKRSADWCLKAIDQCWEQKMPRIRESERADAKAAYEQAKAEYRKILKESVAE
ncbi:MAG: CehA/McbA family metallohydrolase [Gemmataceae bacterium]